MWIKKAGRKKANPVHTGMEHPFVDEMKDIHFASSLQKNKDHLLRIFSDCSDVVIREFQIQKSKKAFIIFVDGLVNSDMVNEMLQSLMVWKGEALTPEALQNVSLPVSQIQSTEQFADFLVSVLGGDTGLVVEGSTTAMMLGVRGAPVRSISEPETESVVRGPREGFVESLRVNTSLIRRKIKTPALKLKPMTVGRQTNTSIVIAYMDDIADPATVAEVIRRIKNINIDGILESGYIEEFIQDTSITPFPLIQYTERPDTVAASLLEGRIAVMVDGTPFVLIAPFTFWMIMQASEDYYERVPISTLIRWLRFIFLIVSLFTPAFYVAVSTFHQDLIPTSLLLSVAASREAIPFPAVIEALIMEITFEALREAGVRLPKTIGQTVSILGALVVGQAAVEAGIVSAPMVIIVSITGIASFTIPRYNGAIAIRMLRFPLIISASLFGAVGIVIMTMLILGHMAKLRSLGVPYLAPLAPANPNALLDILMRAPLQLMKKRPQFLQVQDEDRQSSSMKSIFLKFGGQYGHKSKE
ncbi:spore germination protein [Marinicrinis sediminis]|uniref:Spore germination protein n=1 Tax=Marinicrinis sediminis TaxID=1652465 RepID=A0ABW5R729_9BACL